MGLLARSLGGLPARVDQRSLLSSLKAIAPALYDSMHVSSISGPVVTENVAMRNTVVFSCVRAISETLASLPIYTYQRTEDGKRQAPEHRVYGLLHDQANPLMTAYQVKETLQAHLGVWGNAYAEIERDGNGEVVALWPIPPWRMLSVARTTTGAPDLVYTVQLRDERVISLASERILHIAALGFDGFLGKSPIQLAAEAIGLGLAAEEFTARFFSNGAQMSGFLMHPGELSETARENIRKSFDAQHAGLANVARVALLEEGLKWQESSMKLVDAQLLQLRSFQVADIARIFRVPLYLIAETERTTSWGTGIEQFGQAFITYCLRPWAVRWEQVLKMKLFNAADRPTHFVEYNFDALLRGDKLTRYQAYAIGRQWGWLNADEIRQFENMNPLAGAAGNDYLNPMNMAPASSAVPQDPPPTGTQDEDRARPDYQPLLEAAWERITRRAADEVGSKVAKAARSGDPATMHEAIAGWLVEHRTYVEAQLAPIVAAGWRPGGHLVRA